MSGNRSGGLKAAQTVKARLGEDFYARIGREGGKLGHTGGFYKRPELAREAGRKGGHISKRGPAKPKEDGFFVLDPYIDGPIIDLDRRSLLDKVKEFFA